MLNSTVAKLLNEQINKEMYSAYLYLDFANYYVSKGLNGFANWFNIQAKEEMGHAMLFIQYLQNNNNEVSLASIAKPDKALKDLRVPLVESYNHELTVTASIHNIYAEAGKVNDFRTQQLLQWFIKEQGEEEKNATDLINDFDLYGQPGLFALDGKLALRVYTAPSLVL